MKPKVATYLGNLQSALGQDVALRVLRSDGGMCSETLGTIATLIDHTKGLATLDLASLYPVNLLMSGPSGGVAGVASLIAKQTEYDSASRFLS